MPEFQKPEHIKRIFILFLAICITYAAAGQPASIQVKADSIIEINGTKAKLSGLKMGTAERIYFIYKWRGLSNKIELLDMWFTVYLEEKRSRNGRKISVQKNN